MTDLPAFPPRKTDRGDQDWRSRRRDDGYDYALAATAGAAMARAALEALKPVATKAPLRRRSLADIQTDALSLKVTQEPTQAPIRGAPELTMPPPSWTPHDAMPTTASPGHWADGTPIGDEPDENEEDW